MCNLIRYDVFVLYHFFYISLLKGRPVYIGLAVDLSDYVVNVDPADMKPLNLSIARNPKDIHQAALQTVLDLARKSEKTIVIVDA